MSTTVTIQDVEVVVNDFKLLTNELVMNAVGNETNAFNTVKRELKEELNKSTELDTEQKIGVFVEFLKDAYTTANKQAMATALDILKTNETLKLDAIKLEVAATLEKQRANNLVEEKEGITKDNLLKGKELELADLKIAAQKYTNLEARAKLKKQFGIREETSYQLGDGESLYAQYDNSWYKVNSDASG